MNNKYWLTLSFLLLLSWSVAINSEAELKKKYDSTQSVAIPCKCQLKDSLVVGSEPVKEGCGEGEKNYFQFIGNDDDFNKLHDKMIIIDSWERLKYIKSKFQSPTLNKINRSDFTKYNYAVMFILYADLTYLENERLYGKNSQIYFSYDIWVGQSDVVSSGIQERLYILKLRKKDL